MRPRPSSACFQEFCDVAERLDGTNWGAYKEFTEELEMCVPRFALRSVAIGEDAAGDKVEARLCSPRHVPPAPMLPFARTLSSPSSLILVSRLAAAARIS